MLLRRDVRLSHKEASPGHSRAPASNTVAQLEKLHYGTAQHQTAPLYVASAGHATLPGMGLD